MVERSLILKSLRIAAVGASLAIAYQVLAAAISSHATAWELHVAYTLFIVFLSLLLSWGFVRREQGFLEWVRASEEFGNSVIDHLPVILCIVGADGHFVRWNAQFESKLGYSKDQLSKIKVLETVAEQDRERVKRAMEDTRLGKSVETEASLLHANGRTIPFYTTGSRIVFRGRTCLLGVAIDLSTQKEAQEALRLQAAALRAAANAIVITDREGTIEWVNPAFTVMSGFNAEESVGKTPRIVKSGRHDEAFYRDLWSTISAGHPWQGEITNCRKDGVTYIEEMTITPVISEDGTVGHYVAVKQDVTARKQIEDALRFAEERYRDIFDQAAIGIFQSTPEGRFLMMNKAMARMLRFDSPEQALVEIQEIGRFYNDPAARSQWQEQIEAQGVTHCEREFHLKDGTPLWLSLNIRCIYGEDGMPAYYEGTAEDITNRKLAEKAHLESEERLRLFIEHAPVALAMFDREMRYVRASRRWLSDYRLDRDVTGLSHYEVFPDIPDRWKQAHKRALAGEILREESDCFESAASTIWLRWEARPWYQSEDEIGGIVILTEDVTEKRLLENELRQAQKMEAVGRLAGGVAHDFNNMLGIINGYSELLKLRPDLDKKTLDQVEQIHTAGKKATSLTQQLLAFSRKQILQPQVLGLNDAVAKLSKMLKRLIGEDIELIVRLGSCDTRVKVDPSQVDQAIMNLAINARDAMPNGGKLIIETDVCDLEEGYSMRHRPIVPGRYVRLSLTDTGCGMTHETMSHLFEPFFTTKGLGRGTGLGLSIVYGFVKQSSGYVWAYSEPNQGSSFKIYLPLQSAEVARAHANTAMPECTSGSETILIVEDDSGLRSLLVGVLRGLGYSVFEAGDGEAADEIAATESIDLLITDIVMPRMSGRELADRLLGRKPSLKVLYTSGYTHDGVVQMRELGDGEAFLQKPFGLSELTRMIREVIDKKLPAAPHKAQAQSASSSMGPHS